MAAFTAFLRLGLRPGRFCCFPALLPHEYKDGIHLAVSNNSGSATSGKAVDHNDGIPAPSHFRTVVAFGVRMGVLHFQLAH
jgi:hypothetical protein